MLFKNITILDETLTPRENQYVGTLGDKIEYIGKIFPENYAMFGESYDGKGKLLMPGFVNSHAHSPMTLMRGYGENLVLKDWLEKKIFPFEALLTGQDVYYGTLLAMAESLRYGIISTTDMYYFSEDMVRAILKSRTKNNISRSIVDFAGEGLWNLDGAREMKELYENHNGAGNGSIRVDMSLHGEYTSNPETGRALAEYTKEIGANMHLHLSETRREHEECIKRWGKTPAAYFADLGLFDTKTTAAHCIWVDEDDMDIFKEKGVTVACNPVSNLKLASGVCNVPRLLEKSINVSIGTDGVASNNSLNFIEEIKMFSIAPKMQFHDPTKVTPYEAIFAATRGGALGQGRDDSGILAKGFKADLIVLDIGKPNMKPVHNLLTNVVYSASGSDVVLTMVDGKVLYREGEYSTIDVEEVTFEVEKASERISNQL